MYNALIWSFDEEYIYPAIRKLHEEIIDIKYWAGFKIECPYCTHEINHIWNERFESSYFQGYDSGVYDYVYNCLPQFISQCSRKYMPNRKSFHEYLNKFNIYFEYYYNLIIQNDINLFIFIDLPHDGVDLIIYNIARFLKRKIIIVSQSIFANKFFCISDMDDFGTFATSPIQTEPNWIQIENQFKKDLFYMKERKERYDFKLEKRLWEINKIINTNIFEWMIYELQKFDYKRRYKACIKKHAVKQVDLNRPFVYFPLHLQPEMTTASIGHRYVDQVMALEHLRKKIPPAWYIYVKENPKQTYFMRDTDFFKRMERIPQVVFIDKTYDTYSLLERCKLVSTITGTVGWEAITGGKSVLIFGDAWYKNFPGVFSYQDNIDIDHIAEHKPDFQEVQNALNMLMSKMGQGIVEASSAVAVSDYSHEKNCEMIYNYFKQILAERK